MRFKTSTSKHSGVELLLFLNIIIFKLKQIDLTGEMRGLFKKKITIICFEINDYRLRTIEQYLNSSYYLQKIIRKILLAQ